MYKHTSIYTCNIHIPNTHIHTDIHIYPYIHTHIHTKILLRSLVAWQSYLNRKLPKCGNFGKGGIFTLSPYVRILSSLRHLLVYYISSIPASSHLDHKHLYSRYSMPRAILRTLPKLS